MRLKDEKGIVLEIDDESCYSPNEQGNIIAPLGGFAYFIGKPTTDPITHIVDHGCNNGGGLTGYGDIRQITEDDKILENEKQPEETDKFLSKILNDVVDKRISVEEAVTKIVGFVNEQ